MPIGDQTETFKIQERCIETQAARIKELEADINDTLRAVLFHFGPDGAAKVTKSVLDERAKR